MANDCIQRKGLLATLATGELIVGDGDIDED